MAIDLQERSVTSGGRRPTTSPLVLARYQRGAVEALAEEISTAQADIARRVSRSTVADIRNTFLLIAPTGSGKTLMMGRALQTVAPEPIVAAMGYKGTVWFWFAPYTGLVEQTRKMLRRDCDRLRLRDLELDREPSVTRDGDVFVQTWASVAANNREARRLRRSGESSWSVDDLIEQLRQDKFFIGAVIDEAHINFGTNAKAAASFYLQCLKPDVAVLATATPRDEKLESFRQAAGISAVTRIEIGRGDVVSAGLNKRGLALAYLALTKQQSLAIDPDETILRAAWLQHKKIKRRLQQKRIDLVPLLLVQVPDGSPDQPDPAGVTKRILVDACQVQDSSISIHTSGQPDPAFHLLANNEQIEVLIFKLSAATGFDAPRAWTLASLRPSLTPEFGLQVVGRIMRVHPRVRHERVSDPLLDRGYVYLANPRRQAGLEAAADQLKALRTSIKVVTDDFKIISAADGSAVEADTAIDLEGSSKDLSNEIESQIDNSLSQISDIEKDSPDTILRGGTYRYSLRPDLGVPSSLQRETIPETLPRLAEEAAKHFEVDSAVVALLTQREVNVQLKLRELLLSEHESADIIAAKPSPMRLADAAMSVFACNDDIDPRQFRKHLLGRFKECVIAHGGEAPSEQELRRALDQVAIYQPSRIKAAVKKALSFHVTVVQASPLPESIDDLDGLFSAQRNAYGIFPSTLNDSERNFAKIIDEIDTVRWWLRNPDHPLCPWSVKVILEDGKGYYPDFVVGVAGRKTPDEVRLVEIKDTGETGRLQSDSNFEKIKTQHRTYLKVLWVCEEEQTAQFSRLIFSSAKNRIVRSGAFAREHLADDS